MPNPVINRRLLTRRRQAVFASQASETFDAASAGALLDTTTFGSTGWDGTTFVTRSPYSPQQLGFMTFNDLGTGAITTGATSGVYWDGNIVVH